VRSYAQSGRRRADLLFGRKEETMFGLIRGLGLGAGLMYFLDPDSGERRRAVLGDRFAQLGDVLWPGDRPNAAGLAAGAACGLVLFRLLRRSPMTGLALGTLGLALAAQSFSQLSHGTRDGRGPSLGEAEFGPDAGRWGEAFVGSGDDHPRPFRSPAFDRSELAPGEPPGTAGSEWNRPPGGL
jgi:hypothetical protein